MSAPAERKLPPVYGLAVASMILVVLGGIYTAAYIPSLPSLAIPVALLGLSALLLLVNLALLSRLKPFAWGRFFQVGLWALFAYVIIAGMLEFVFAVDGTPGPVMALLTGMLVIYAVDVPLLFAFSVARYQPAG